MLEPMRGASLPLVFSTIAVASSFGHSTDMNYTSPRYTIARINGTLQLIVAVC